MNNLQGSSTPLQGSSTSLQGSTQQLQGSSTPTQNYGNVAATSPAKEKYINDLSAKYGISGGTVYDKATNQGLDLNAFKQATGIQNPDWSSLKFDEAYKPISFGSSIPQSALTPSTQNTQPTQLPQITQPSDPMAKYKDAFSKYIEALKPSAEVTDAQKKYLDFIQSAESGIAGLEGQGRGIPLSLVRGQQEKLGKQAEITAKRLQGDIGLAEDLQKSRIDAARAGIDLESELLQGRQTQEDRALKTLQSTVPALLAEFNRLPAGQRDAYVIQKANELGLSIDQVNSALQSGLTPQDYIKVGEGDTLFDPNTGKVIFTAPKTYAPGTNASGLTPAQINSTVNSIAGAFDNEPIVKAYNTAQEGYQTITSIGVNTQSPADDIAFIYAFAKIMDPNSVVREGEYNTVQRYAQTWADNFGFSVKRLYSNTNFLTPDAKQKMINALTPKINTLTQQYKQVSNEYQRQINDAYSGLPRTITNYDITGGGGGGADDFINNVLGFNSVGNTSASTGMRTDRHNNPTAFTTDIAKNAGLVLGKDYIVGDPFPNNPNLKTAKLLGDPVAQTIKVIDRIGFYTQSGKPRWSYVSQIPQANNWRNLSYQQKKNVIAQMYKKEGGSKLNQYFA